MSYSEKSIEFLREFVLILKHFDKPRQTQNSTKLERPRKILLAASNRCHGRSFQFASACPVQNPCLKILQSGALATV